MLVISKQNSGQASVDKRTPELQLPVSFSTGNLATVFVEISF